MQNSLTRPMAILGLALIMLPGIAIAAPDPSSVPPAPPDHVGSSGGDHTSNASGNEAYVGFPKKPKPKPTMFCDNASAYQMPNSVLFWNKGPGTVPAGTKVVITIQPTGQKLTYILTQDWDVKTGIFLPVPIETSQPIHCSADILGIDRKSVPHP
jgi:hypothetical protein